MKSRTVIEYSVMFQDEDLKAFGNTWDVTTELDQDLAVDYVLKLAEKKALEEDLEVLAMARAEKRLFYGESLDEYAVNYLTPFEHVDIYAKEIHPPKRFRDIANAE